MYMMYMMYMMYISTTSIGAQVRFNNFMREEEVRRVGEVLFTFTNFEQ